MRKFHSRASDCEAEQWHRPESADLFPPGAIRTFIDEDRFYVVTAHDQIAFLAPGDWVIAEPNAPDRYYPCKPDVFEKRWEEDCNNVNHVWDLSGRCLKCGANALQPEEVK